MRSWQAVDIDLWDSIPSNILLQGNRSRWRTVLQDMQRYVSAFMHCIIKTMRFTKPKKGLTCIGVTALLGYLDLEGILSVCLRNMPPLSKKEH